MNNVMRTPSTRQVGASLIELMIAMFIGLILVATIGNAYVGAKQGFHTLNALSRIQEGARYAFEFMGNETRMAGYTGGPANGGTNVVNDPPSGWNPGLKHLFGDEGDTTRAPLIGLDDTAPANVCTTANTSPCYRQGDVLTVVHADNENEYALTDHTVPDFTLSCWPGAVGCSTVTPPAPGDIFVVSDYTHSAVFQISTVNSGARTVSHATGVATPDNSGTNLGVFSGPITARKLYRLKGVSFYIGTNPAGEPALYRHRLSHTGTAANATSEELVEGVENMQIMYGVDWDDTDDNNRDVNGNYTGRFVHAYWTAAQVSAGTDGVNNLPGGANVQARWSRVFSVRIDLTMVSRQDQSIASTGDRLLRKTITNTLAVRNRLQ